MNVIWTRFQKWIIALLTVLVATFGAVGGASYTGSIAGKQSHFYQLTTTDTMTAGTSVTAGTGLVAGTSVAAGTSLSAGSFLTVTTQIRARPSANITCSANATITPTASYTPITAAGAVEITITATSRVVGEILILHNVGAQTITVKDVNINGTGDLALATLDSAMYIFGDDGKWLQLATSNN